MSAPAIALANQALRLLAAEQIESLDEGTEQANTVVQVYPTTVACLLSAHPWRFTLRKAQLARLADPPLTEWPHQHAVPADMLTLRTLFAGAGSRTPVRDYEIFERRVLSAQEELWADYQCSPDAGRFPPWFANLARTALAADLAIPVGVGTERADYFRRIAFGSPAEGGNGGLMQVARRVDSQQAPPQRITDFPLITARFGGRAGSAG